MPRIAALAMLLALAAPAAWAAKPRPLASVLGTCSALTPNTYPADTVNWFDPARHSQAVFYAHLLFPTQPEPEEAAAGVTEAALPAFGSARWHPPLALSPTAALLPAAASAARFVDEFWADAEWLDPDGKRIAFYGLTFPARISSDYVRLQGRSYAPHTFAMAIGLKELRTDAGQTALPIKEGLYTVRFRVDGLPLGVAFFSMLRGVRSAAAKADAAAATAPAGADRPLLLSPTAR